MTCNMTLCLRGSNNTFRFLINSLVILYFSKKTNTYLFLGYILTITGSSGRLSQPMTSTSAGGTCDSLPGMQNSKPCERNGIVSERNSILLAQNTSVLERNIIAWKQNNILWTRIYFASERNRVRVNKIVMLGTEMFFFIWSHQLVF